MMGRGGGSPPVKRKNAGQHLVPRGEHGTFIHTNDATEEKMKIVTENNASFDIIYTIWLN